MSKLLVTKREFVDEMEVKGGMFLPAAYATGHLEGRYKLWCECVAGAYRMYLSDGQEHVKELPYVDLDDLYEACGGQYATHIICEYLEEFVERYERALEKEKTELAQIVPILREFPEDKIFMTLIPYRKMICEEFPGRICGNTYMVYEAMVDKVEQQSKECIRSIIITQELMKKWQISEKELYEAAMKTMPRLFPYSIDNLNGIFGKNVYAISTIQGCFGTGTLFYQEGPLKELALELKDDLYVLPLSVHEAIVFPAEFWIQETEYMSLSKEISPFGGEVWYYNRILNDLAFTKKERSNQELKLKDGILDPAERRKIDADVR